MPLQMDIAYQAAKKKILSENTRIVEKQVVKSFGEEKGRSIVNGLFPKRDDQSQARAVRAAAGILKR